MSASKKRSSKRFFSSSTSSMLSTPSKASDEDLSVYCQPCDHEGIRLPAHGFCADCKEHLCTTCFNVHKKQRITRQHTLLDSTSMPQSLFDISASFSDNLTTPCPKHSKEKIKFYCTDHKDLVCNVCVTLKHQSSRCKVNYIPEISGDIIDSKEYQDFLKEADTAFDQYQKIVNDVKKMEGKSKISIQYVLADIKKYRQEINQRLDVLEKQAEEAANAIEQDINNLKIVEAKCEDITKSMKKLSDRIKQLNTSKQADRLFMELKVAEKTLKDVEKNTQQLKLFDVIEQSFKPNDSILTLLKTEKSLGTLGTITKKSLSAKFSKSVQKKSKQASDLGKVCVKTEKDKYECLITGMVSLSPECLVITDYYNKSVKMVAINSQSVTDQLQVDGGPWDITRVTSTELAVTFSLKQTIQFISVSSDKLTKTTTLKVDGVCHGISCYKDKLVVSFCHPAELQILDMKGTVLRTIEGNNNFKSPQHVTTNSSSIFVSDLEMRRVTRLNWKGHVIDCYRDLGNPCGIAFSDVGTMFVCDDERNVIEELSEDCSTGNALLVDMKKPQAICWCGKTRKLYFSCSCHNTKYDNFIHVYKHTQT